MIFARTTRSCFASLLSATLLSVVLSACAGGGGTQSPTPLQQSVTASSPNQNQLNTTTTPAAYSTFRYHLYPVKERGAAVKTQAVNYPADLQYFGGPVVTTALSHNVYVDCAASCWGNPQLFLDNLNDSTFIHVVDQYVHATANYRYRFGENYSAYVKFTTNQMSENQIINVVHAAALRLGGGYHNIYHVFLPAGIDTCIQGTTECYSPDNLPNWSFCAYHSSVDFSDAAGHVLFTVEPYQAVFGCSVANGPNSMLVDSTDSTLSHEYIETLTDPDPNSAWFNLTFNGEVADLCAGYDDVDTLYYNRYDIQEEYSNKLHGCTN
jgi:hypothetical protein